MAIANTKTLLFVIFLYLILLPLPATAQEYIGRVVGISDGDTLTLLDNQKQQIKDFGLFLQNTVGPLARRVLLALGFGYLIFGSITTAINSLIASAQGYFNGIPSFALNFLQMAGLGQVLTIIAGAILVRVAFGTSKTIGIFFHNHKLWRSI
ncbi:DUF2523 domain-containing protein [Nitrosomonas communis]|uniref:Uncharacterized protein n=1 Tax=Nitrosomonas communis TaxID=44574 RepID=A0A1I4RMN7_9PROT|nr:DUF2523 domain-containing protein [Nitrosomonas communis]SFM53396.1 Protein of unknown function [Nitrosomonas communis]